MKTALILPGGGTKGALEVGALKVILKKFKPDVVIGTSIGSLNAAFLLDGKDIHHNLARLEGLWKKITQKTFFSFNYNLFSKSSDDKTILTNKGIRKFLEDYLIAKKFSDLCLPLYVNCTNLKTGKSKYFSSGELIPPLLASCGAIPAFPPVKIGKETYVDGAFGSTFGIEMARKLGCERLIVVNIDYHESFELEKKSIKAYSELAIALIRNQNVLLELKQCKEHKLDIIEIRVKSPTYEPVPFGMKNIDAMIKAGEDAAKKRLRWSGILGRI